MKKLGFIFLLMLTISCQKEPQLVNITIGLNRADTKIMSSSPIINTINNCISNIQLTFTLTNKRTSTVYSCKEGEALTVPVGEYKVVSRYKPNAAASVNGSVYFMREPRLFIDTSLTINNETTRYEVDAEYECFVVAIDCREVSYFGYYVYSDLKEIPTIVDGYYAIAFIYASEGELLTTPLQIIAIPPVTSDYEEHTFSLYKKYVVENTYVKNGEWYLFHPTEVEKLESSFIINYPDWIAGEVH